LRALSVLGACDTDKARKALPDVPATGSLDLDEVEHSQFFFA